jgi:hypothetical protein
MRSINAQVGKDIKAAKKIWLPWRLLLPLIALCIPAYALFDYYGKENLAVPVLMCAALFGFLIYLKWSLRRQPLFWAIILLLAAVHAALVWYIPWTTKWVPAAAIGGIGSVDLCVMLWTLAAVEAWLGGQSEADVCNPSSAD